MNNNILCIIPARKGSKRIPEKNIKLFNGHPIIYYAIRAANDSHLFSDIMVSTDSQEIKSIAENYGANVPFLRSIKNSDDYATTSAVLIEVLDNYLSLGKAFDYACCIYPTAIFISSGKLIQGFNLLLQSGSDTVFPVSEIGGKLWRSFSISDSKLKLNFPEFINSRSQDLPKSYVDSGQFYFFRVESFRQKNNLITDNCSPIIVSEAEVQDIDSEEDWNLAEYKFNKLNSIQ